MISEKNVVDFKDRHPPTVTQSAPIIAECRKLFQQEFTPVLSRFFDKVDDELFAMSDKAVSSTVQELYFEAMRYLRRERENVERQYLQALLKGYDEFWKAKPGQGFSSQSATSLELDEDDLSLVENETLETDLAVATLINKGNNLFHRDLYALNKRFAKLLTRTEIGNEENPLAPYKLGKTFAEVLKPLTLELKVKLVLFKLYENHVVGSLEVVYDILNENLAEKGILPEIPHKIRKRGSDGRAAKGDAETSSASQELNGEIPDQAVYVQAIQAMHTLLSAWRGQVGLPSLASIAHEPGVVVSETQELVGALSSLQDPGEVASLTEQLQQGEANNVKFIVAQHLSEVHGGKRALSQVDEDIIDMIGMIFDFILEDRDLPSRVKATIGRLQIPIIKLAILDKSFFSKKNHPARVLLNQLAQAGISLSGDDELDDNPIFQRIHVIVERILNEFNQEVALFDDLLKEFLGFMEQEGKRSARLEERTRQATQSKEHLLLAKKQVADEIARRMHETELSSRLKHFFTTTWRDVLLLSCLRKERDPDAWTAKLSLTDTLFWTLMQPHDDAERKRIIQRIPGVLRALRKELEEISLDPKQMALLFKELENAHQGLLQNETRGANQQLERELREISSNLPDVDVLDITDLTTFDEGDLDEEIILLSEETVDADADEFVHKAKSMEVGDWMELEDPSGKTQRVKLSWVSKVTGIRVFVNRRGMKVAEYTLNGLAAELRRGRAAIIDGAKVPLMDRALSSMMSTLKHPVTQNSGQQVGDPAPALN